MKKQEVRRLGTKSVSVFESFEARRLLSLVGIGSTTFASARSEVAVAADGSYLVASESGGVQITRYSAAGKQIGDPLSLYSNNDFFDGALAISIDPNGDAVVAYSVHNSENSLADGIYFNRISSNGTASSRQAVSGSANADLPSVSMDDNGGFFVAWIDNGSALMQSFDSAATANGAAFVVSTFESGTTLERVVVSSLHDGSGAVFAYDQRSTFEDGTPNELIGRTSQSATIGHAVGVGGENGSIATQADGSFILIFQRGVPVAAAITTHTTYVQEFHANVTSVRKATQLGLELDSPIGAGGGITPTGIALAGDGSFVVSYVQSVAVGGASVESTLYAQRFTAAGVADEAGPVSFFQGISASPISSTLTVPSGNIGIDVNGNVVVAIDYADKSGAKTTGLFRATTNFAALDNGTLYLFGTAHDDSLSVKNKGSSSVVAALGNSTLKFTAADITTISFEGFRGDDRIYNETSIGSTMRGDDGNDELSGGAAHDSIFGGDGNDRIYGNDGNDTIYGQNGNDYLRGGNNDDSIDGANGNDTIFGDDGSDRLFGSVGNDRVYGGTGSDSMFGGVGNDFFSTKDDTNDHVDGEAGTNTASADSIDNLLNIQHRS